MTMPTGTPPETGAQGDTDPTATGASTDAGVSGAASPDAGATGAQLPQTQEELDRIIGGKVAAKLRSYGDLNELRAKAAEYDKVKEAQLTNEERLTNRIKELEQGQTAWKQERSDLLLRSAVTSAAGAIGFADPSDAVALLDRSVVAFDEDGSPEPGSVATALQALAAAKPHLLVRMNTSFDGGVRVPQMSGNGDPNAAMNEMLMRARRR